MFTRSTRPEKRVSPLEAAFYGIAGGLAGTLVLTVLARITPGIKAESRKPSRQASLKLPEDPSNEQKVTEWQDHARSPAAYSPQPAQDKAARGHAAAVTPAGALAEAQGPDPEAAAEEFFVKLGSGLFGVAVSRYTKPAGKVLHFVYGSFWGLVYGILQGKRRRNVWRAGALHGICVWSVGPGSLVPAMRLMLPVWKAPKRQTSLMLAGHVIYGITLASLFDARMRRSR